MNKKEQIKFIEDNYPLKLHHISKRKFDKFNYYANTESTQIITEWRNAQELSVNESNNTPKSSEHLNSDEKDDDVR